MTDWERGAGPDESAAGYQGPPATEQFAPPQYPPAPQYPQYPAQNPYPAAQYPAAQYPAPYGYPQPYGYPGGYPPAPTGPARPGLATAAIVLGYVNAGLLILAGALLLFGASIISDLENGLGSGTDYGTELALDGFVNLVAAGLLIAGAVMFSGRRSGGRIMFAAANAIVLLEAVYWLVRFSDDRFDTQSYIVWAVLFSALAALGLAFSFAGDVTRWLRGSSQPA